MIEISTTNRHEEGVQNTLTKQKLMLTMSPSHPYFSAYPNSIKNRKDINPTIPHLQIKRIDDTASVVLDNETLAAPEETNRPNWQKG